MSRRARSLSVLAGLWSGRGRSDLARGRSARAFTATARRYNRHGDRGQEELGVAAGPDYARDTELMAGRSRSQWAGAALSGAPVRPGS
ncbi:MAG: hypothetical protein M0020_07645 [Actinomycetota bacterium]|nr:hypothetical protein [Actinomycetota bacterium]